MSNNTIGQMLKDPAAGLPPTLLPHVHLLSKHRYPITTNPSLETIVGYLLEAPKIVRELQPMQWQFIDTPQDGTLLLAWQPIDYLQTNFSSDGYVWADVEASFKSEVRGYTLEMFLQRSGYRAQGEAIASHSRRRYRLLPGNPSMGQQPPDPSLWLIHYSKASTRDHIPAASIPIPPHVQASMAQRRLIQSQGQLPRKDFLLHDRHNWPIIHLPQGMARAPPLPGQIPQQAPGHRRGPSVSQDTTLEDEEDVSRGDILDFMTPRDISRMRYEQHHEWMEEVIESPYPISSIVPSDLGLGRKGRLEELTKDFFDAPVSILRDSADGPPSRVGRLVPGEFDKFQKRADEKLAQLQAELDKMKEIHQKRMGKAGRYKVLHDAEKKLRTAPNVTDRRRSSTAMVVDDGGETHKDAIDEIASDVESALHKKIERTSVVTLVQRGGLEDRIASTPSAIGPGAVLATSPEKAPTPAALANTATAAEPDAQKTEPMADDEKKQKPQAVAPPETIEQKTTSTASSDEQPTPSVPQADPSTDSNQQSHAGEAQEEQGLRLDDMGMDVNMDDLDDGNGPGDNTNGDGNEWVMINEDGGHHAEDLNLADIPGDEQPQSDQVNMQQNTEGNDSSVTAGQPVPQQPNHATPLDTPDFGMEEEFDNVDVDTAGDALASYGNDEDELNLDGMEDSAFGDAFHPQEDEDIS
ncbi:uncharacterized protein A1O9_09549 [Exophiala aquamarina CBS 119918]|uniref:DUF1750-domain-containing protein n=1 Tax=Exophiala aquamarina CBS 119918 TaxID=1182545 RepID=A0A072P539_9EURO|nr:uncharacterized protein A1O9_09549 [Exophiala aquamarina CBS 119918]KEF54383.1 hypothetical protein A1O9_09549 [Exophiala aquamarina CBS 119918]